jgi:hypothetical protein
MPLAYYEARMHANAKPIALIGLLFGALLLGGCPEYADISPEDGRNEVPVDAIIHIRFVTNSPIDEDEISSETIAVTQCAAGLGTEKPGETKTAESTSKPTDGTAKTSTDKKEETKQGTGTAVEGEFITRVISGATKDNERFVVTEIFFMPKVGAEARGYLLPGQAYCVDVKPLMKADGSETAPSVAKFFTAPRVGSDQQRGFEKKPTAKILNIGSANSASLAPQDGVFVKFDGKVNPWRLAATKFCTDPSENSTYDPDKVRTCEGAMADSLIYQVEEFKRGKDGLVRPTSNLFALISSGLLISPFEEESGSEQDEEHFKAESNYTLRLLLSPIGKKENQREVSVPVSGPRSFKIDRPRDDGAVEEFLLEDLKMNPQKTYFIQVK